MKNMFLITILILLTNFVTFRVAIEKNLQLIRSEDEIIAEIQLVTNCELSHESFIVVDLETKKMWVLILAKLTFEQLKVTDCKSSWIQNSGM